MLAAFIKFMFVYFYLSRPRPPHIGWCTDKVFSFLSKDEVEKLKQEEEKKIATLQRGGSGKKNKALATASDLVDASNQVVPADTDDEEQEDDDQDEDEEDDEDEETDDTDEDDDDDDEDDGDDADQDDHFRGSR